jgi:hypothetical protein
VLRNKLPHLATCLASTISFFSFDTRFFGSAGQQPHLATCLASTISFTYTHTQDEEMQKLRRDLQGMWVGGGGGGEHETVVGGMPVCVLVGGGECVRVRWGSGK